MTARTACHGLQVDTILYRFIEDRVLPGTGIDSDSWWGGFAQIVHDLSPKNALLLAERDRLQSELDAWHIAHPGPVKDIPAYRKFLESIGYLFRCLNLSKSPPTMSTQSYRPRPARSWWYRF